MSDPTKRFLKSKAIGNIGESYVKKIVSECGSIYRDILGQEDLGIDAHIEIIDGERVTNEHIAVQIKSGKSYASGNYLIIPANRETFQYWVNYPIPVVGIVFDPVVQKAYWKNITAFLERNQDRIKNGPFRVSIPRTYEFNKETFQYDIRVSFKAYRGRGNLFKYGDLALSPDEKDRYLGIIGLRSHLLSNDSYLTCHLLGLNSEADDIDLRRLVYDSISRYLPHPEIGFLASKKIREYIKYRSKVWQKTHHQNA